MTPVIHQLRLARLAHIAFIRYHNRRLPFSRIAWELDRHPQAFIREQQRALFDASLEVGSPSSGFHMSVRTGTGALNYNNSAFFAARFGIPDVRVRACSAA